MSSAVSVSTAKDSRRVRPRHQRPCSLYYWSLILCAGILRVRWASCLPVLQDSARTAPDWPEPIDPVETARHGRTLLQTTQESFLFSECDCEGWICNTGYFQKFSFESNCWGCEPCPTSCEAGFFLGGPCNPFSSPCKPCTVCTGVQIVAEPCGATTDAVCYDCGQCLAMLNTSRSECLDLVLNPVLMSTNSSNHTNATNATNLTLTTPPPRVVDPLLELFCRLCPELPPKASYTGQFDAGGKCGFQCEPPFFLTETGECSCGSGFLNQSAQECQTCTICPQGYVRECNATHNAVCFQCLNDLSPLCTYNGTFNASTGICDVMCDAPECLDCEPGTVRPEGANCSIECEACTTILPANTKFSIGCEYVCQDNFYLARGTCNPCSVCTVGQYQNAPCQETQDTDCRDCPNQQLPPFASYTGEYDSSRLQCSIQCEGEVPLSANGEECRCPAQQFVNTSIVPFHCTRCKSCREGEVETAACGLQSDTQCLSCGHSDGTFISVTETGSACLPCSSCRDGSYPVNASCFGSSDTVCIPCTTCGMAQYQAVPCKSDEPKGDTQCANCSVCPLGEYVAKACNTTEDVVCGLCNNTKPAGAEWTGGDLTAECTWTCSENFERSMSAGGVWSCSACKAGFYEQGSNCEACSTCTSLGEFESSSCNATTNAVCSSCAGKPDEADFVSGVSNCDWICRAGFSRLGGNCTACQGSPQNSEFTTANQCVWACKPGFSFDSESEACLCDEGWYDTAAGLCQLCGSCDPTTQIPIESCNATFQGLCAACPNAKPTQAEYTGVWDPVQGECPWECIVGWTREAPAEVNASGSVATCYECAVCALGQFTSTACTVQRNTVCQACPNTLPLDAEWTGAYARGECGYACPANSAINEGETACECEVGHIRKSDRSCAPCQECGPGLKVVQVCSGANDTVCGSCINLLPNNSVFDGAVDEITGDCSWTCKSGWTFYRENVTMFPTTSTTTSTVPETTTVETTTSGLTTTTPAPNGTNMTAVMTTFPLPPPPETTAVAAPTGPRGIVVEVEGCRRCTKCLPGTFVQSACTPLQDTECVPCPNDIPKGAQYRFELDDRGFCNFTCPAGSSCTCGPGQWWDDSGFGECKTCTVCAPGLYMTRECMVEQDTMCAACPNEPPEKEVFTVDSEFDARKGTCSTFCLPGWVRFVPPQNLPPVPTPGSDAANVSDALSSNVSQTPIAMTTSAMGTPAPAGSHDNNNTCICPESKILTADGGCSFCSLCQPGTLLSKPCNASANQDTECRPCPNEKVVGSRWLPGGNGTLVGVDDRCAWKCLDGLSTVQEGDRTICLCLSQPGSCGYCPLLPGNATRIGSWCNAYEYLFDGSCRQKVGTGLRMTLFFRFADWTVEGFGQKIDPFKATVVSILNANVNQFIVDVANLGRRRASPLTVPTFLDGVAVSNVLSMLASPDELNARFAAVGIPPADVMLGNSTAIAAEVEVEENITVAAEVFLEEEDTVATPLGLILGIVGGFLGLFVLAGLYFLLYKSRQAAQSVSCAMPTSAVTKDEANPAGAAEAVEGKDANGDSGTKPKGVGGLLGFMKKPKQ